MLDNLASHTDFVKVIERRQGLKIACLEKSVLQGWLDEAGVQASPKPTALRLRRLPVERLGEKPDPRGVPLQKRINAS